jgi:hypothetical protein
MFAFMRNWSSKLFENQSDHQAISKRTYAHIVWIYAKIRDAWHPDHPKVWELIYTCILPYKL